MAVREFDASDDRIDFSYGAAATFNLAGQSGVVICKRANDSTSIQLALSINDDPAGTPDDWRWAFGIWNNNIALFSNGGSETQGFAVGTGDGWVLLGWNKATGSATVRFHKVVMSTSTATHSNAGAISNATGPNAGGFIRAGGNQNNANAANLFAGRVAASALYNGQLNDGDFETIAAGAQEMLDAGIGGAIAMWLLNQASTSTPVDDVTGGGADQTAITGTTVITGDDPPGFDFSLGGGTVDLAPVVLTLTAQPVDPQPGMVTVALTPAALTLTAQPLGAAPGLVTVALAPAGLALTAPPVTPVPGMVTVDLVPAVLTLTAVPSLPPVPPIIERPFTGITARPSSGITPRP